MTNAPGSPIAVRAAAGHTSVLARIGAEWNLPALTLRDADAETVMDFLDTSTAALLQPPTVQRPSATGPSHLSLVSGLRNPRNALNPRTAVRSSRTC